MLARERAVEGVPAEVVISAYRDGVRFGWNTLLESAEPAERAQLADVADFFFRHLELISRTVAEAYAEQQEAPSSNEERRARALLGSLTHPRPLDAP